MSPSLFCWGLGFFMEKMMLKHHLQLPSTNDKAYRWKRKICFPSTLSNAQEKGWEGSPLWIIPCSSFCKTSDKESANMWWGHYLSWQEIPPHSWCSHLLSLSCWGCRIWKRLKNNKNFLWIWLLSQMLGNDFTGLQMAILLYGIPQLFQLSKLLRLKLLGFDPQQKREIFPTGKKISGSPSKGPSSSRIHPP